MKSWFPSTFNVVSLFPSIPLDTARQLAEALLTNDSPWQSRTNVDIQDILDLLDLCLSTEFCFDNKYYRQVSGTPTGSTLSSFLAEKVMQDLERKAVTNNNDIKTWDRYEDDVLATVKKDKVDNILHTVNNTTKNITFTKEEEHDNKLAFLDVLLTKTDDGNLNTQVYRKKTHTDQLLNYNSNHPTQHKVSCIKTLFNRIDRHCNTDQSKQEERKYLYSTFYKNDYPAHFINKVLSRKKQTNINQPMKTKTRITLPYIHTASEMSSRLLRPFNVDVAHKPINKLGSNFTKHKDKTHTTNKHNAIYMFNCANCRERYISQTSKKIQIRLTEHQNAINRHDHN